MYSCEGCGKNYKTQRGLDRHGKKATCKREIAEETHVRQDPVEVNLREDNLSDEISESGNPILSSPQKSKKIRSEFSKAGRKEIRDRFKMMCALCDVIVPSENGQCAHVISRKNKGPRSYTQYERYSALPIDILKKLFDHPDNGLWLCHSCHNKIDDNPTTYTYEYLENIRLVKTSELSKVKSDEQYPHELKRWRRSIDMTIEGIELNRVSDVFPSMEKFLNNEELNPCHWLQLFDRLVRPLTRKCIFLDHQQMNMLIQNYCRHLKTESIIQSQVETQDELIEYVFYIAEDYICKNKECAPSYTFANEDMRGSLNVLKVCLYLLAIVGQEQCERIKDLLDHYVNKFGIDDTSIRKYLRYLILAGNVFRQTNDLYGLEVLWGGTYPGYSWEFYHFGRHRTIINRHSKLELDLEQEVLTILQECDEDVGDKPKIEGAIILKKLKVLSQDTVDGNLKFVRSDPYNYYTIRCERVNGDIIIQDVKGMNGGTMYIKIVETGELIKTTNLWDEYCKNESWDYEEAQIVNSPDDPSQYKFLDATDFYRREIRNVRDLEDQDERFTIESRESQPTSDEQSSSNPVQRVSDTLSTESPTVTSTNSEVSPEAPKKQTRKIVVKAKPSRKRRPPSDDDTQSSMISG